MLWQIRIRETCALRESHVPERESEFQALKVAKPLHVFRGGMWRTVNGQQIFAGEGDSAELHEA